MDRTGQDILAEMPYFFFFFFWPQEILVEPLYSASHAIYTSAQIPIRSVHRGGGGWGRTGRDIFAQMAYVYKEKFCEPPSALPLTGHRTGNLEVIWMH